MTENFIELFQNYHDQLISEEIYEQNLQRVEDAKKEHEEFLLFHENDMCYICKKSYKTISKENPCVHWLLREGKFKKKILKVFI